MRQWRLIIAIVSGSDASVGFSLSDVVFTMYRGPAGAPEALRAAPWNMVKMNYSDDGSAER